jgi:hypothetical protein
MTISLAQTAAALSLEVANLGETPFEGSARLVDTSGLEPVSTDLPLVLPAAGSKAALRFALKDRPAGAFRCGLVIEDAAGHEVARLPTQRYLPVDERLLVTGRLEPDGDAKIGSEQSLAKGRAPVPHPDLAATVMQLAYRFDKGWKFLRLVPPSGRHEMPGKPKAVGLWIYGDGQRAVPRLRVVDSSGQTFQPDGPAIDWTGWRFVRFEWTPATQHWGGAGDGLVHYPLSWDCLFLLDNASREPLAGKIYLAAPVIVE